jgi:rhamnosyltransferase
MSATATLVNARVAVLLATYNGADWLADQLDSLMRQQGVQLHVIASDDGSSDNTLSLLHRYSAQLPLTVLSACDRLGSANANFIRLICEADLGDADHVALCDQDDVWFDNKLLRSVQTILTRDLDAYSSDVLAFWPDGRERALKKAGRVRRFDHLFEAPGPGCTIVIKRSAFDAMRSFVLLNRDALQPLKHDWWMYARGRVMGWRWFIDPEPTLRYRQHSTNEVGANVGWAAAKRRWHSVRCGQYRLDALAVATAVGERSATAMLLKRYGWRERVALSLQAHQCRRRPHEALLLALFHWAAR